MDKPTISYSTEEVKGLLVALDDGRVCLRLDHKSAPQAPWYFATQFGWVAAGQEGSDILEAAWKEEQAKEKA